MLVTDNKTEHSIEGEAELVAFLLKMHRTPSSIPVLHKTGTHQYLGRGKSEGGASVLRLASVAERTGGQPELRETQTPNKSNPQG